LDAFWSFLKITVIGLLSLIGLALILLAFRPTLKSTLRELASWFGLLGSTGLIVSPLDLIPDFVPFFGFDDDVLYLIGAVLCAVLIRRERRLRSARSAEPLEGQLVFPGFEKEIKPWQTTITTRRSES
jgi:uncharacterized membrane protein YkvA (DUF1232 family)